MTTPQQPFPGPPLQNPYPQAPSASWPQPAPNGYGALRAAPLNDRFLSEYTRSHPSILDDMVPEFSIGDYRADFAWPHLKLLLELDGYTEHSSRDAWAQDRRKDLHYALAGWRVIRIDGDLIRQDAHGVLNQLGRIAEQLSSAQLTSQIANSLARIASVLERIEGRFIPKLELPSGAE